MKKQIIPIIKSIINPTVSQNIAAGYTKGQHWFNETSGVEYVHKSDGVWVEVGSGGNFLSSVSTDSTITGNGTVGSPLSIATTLGDINTILTSI